MKLILLINLNSNKKRNKKKLGYKQNILKMLIKSVSKNYLLKLPLCYLYPLSITPLIQ